MLSQRALEAFREVMRFGTMSGAAEELRVSQPAVSRLIRELETRLDLRLFSRHGGRINATPEAHELWTEVERNLIGMKQIERAAEQIKGGQRATLTIAAAPAFALTVLPDAVAELQTQYPELNAKFLSMTTLPVFRQVALRQCQIGFGMLSHHKFDTDTIHSGALPYRFICQTSHPLADKNYITVQDLAGEDFIGFDDSTMTGRNQDRLFSKMSRPPVVRFRSYLSHIVSALVLRGLGVGVVDPFTAITHEKMGGVSQPFQSTDRFEYVVIKAIGDKLTVESEILVQLFVKLTNQYHTE